MKARILALWLVLSFIVQGCNASIETSVITHTQEPTKASIKTATRSVPPTFFPSTTVLPVASPSKTITNTPLLTPEPVHTVQPACFTVLPALPDIESYHGKILFLEDGNYKKVQDIHYLASFYDLTTRQSKPLNPEKVMNIVASPDGQTYAILDATSKIVRFYSENGQLLKTLPPAEYMYGLDHWLDNKQIALNVLQPWGEDQVRYPIDQMIYNPFTGEREQFISEQYPGHRSGKFKHVLGRG